MKIKKRILGTVCVLGLVLMLGTAGASDCDSITFGRIIIQSVIGLTMFAGAGYWGGFMQ